MLLFFSDRRIVNHLFCRTRRTSRTQATPSRTTPRECRTVQHAALASLPTRIVAALLFVLCLFFPAYAGVEYQADLATANATSAANLVDTRPLNLAAEYEVAMKKVGAEGIRQQKEKAAAAADAAEAERIRQQKEAAAAEAERVRREEEAEAAAIAATAAADAAMAASVAERKSVAPKWFAAAAALADMALAAAAAAAASKAAEEAEAQAQALEAAAKEAEAAAAAAEARLGEAKGARIPPRKAKMNTSRLDTLWAVCDVAGEFGS